MRFDLSLYLVLDPDLCAPVGMIETARRAVAGGATIVQLRHKTATTAELIEIGNGLKSALADTGVPLIVNDDVDAALAINADGVHVGQQDVAARHIRRRIGPSKILGLSIGSEAEADAVDPHLVDYVGIGPVFPTETKPGHAPPIGIDGLGALARRIGLPSVAIGGLKLAHIDYVLASGAKGLAVVSAICGHPDPEQAAYDLATEIRRVRS
jgi:thiamine-phosphate pyrophosphorylase